MPPKTEQFTCPICGDIANAAVIRRIDADKDPATMRRLMSGEINRVVCPTCGHAGLQSEPLVIVSETHKIAVSLVPFQLPANRKAGISGKLRAAAERDAGQYARAHVCFGMRQLREILPGLPSERDAKDTFRRFDSVGSIHHQVRALQIATGKRPEDTRVRSRLGLALFDLGILGAARRLITAVVNEDPSDADAVRCLGSIQLDSGSAAEALTSFDRAYSLGRDPICAFLGGVAAHRCGRHDDALKRFQQAIKGNPGYIDAYIWTAIVHTTQGRASDAIEAIRSAHFNGLRDTGIIKARTELAPLLQERAYRSLLDQIDEPRDRGQRKAARRDPRKRPPTERDTPPSHGRRGNSSDTARKTKGSSASRRPAVDKRPNTRRGSSR